jgi:ankyrin repeat protein
MLLNFGANPRLTTSNGESALTLACMQENVEICERLIIAKANVNELDHHQRTPLLKAARHNGSSDILRLLLKHGAKPDIADEEGNTPLHFAAQRGTQELAKFLLTLGANPYMRNI